MILLLIMSKIDWRDDLINMFCGESKILLNEDVVQLILEFFGYNSSKFGVYRHAYGYSRTNLIVSKPVLKKYLDNIFCGKPKKKSQYQFFRTIYVSSNKFYNYIFCRKPISKLKKSNSRILLNHYVFQLILDFLGDNFYSSSEFIKNYYKPLTKDLEWTPRFRDSWDPFPTYLFICNQKKIIKIENYSKKKISNLLKKECLSEGKNCVPGQWIKYTGTKSFFEGRYSISFLSYSSPKSGLYPVHGLY